MSDHIVAFPEKLLKTIATRCAIFSLKFTKNRLATGLRPDPLGELVNYILRNYRNYPRRQCRSAWIARSRPSVC